MEQIKKVKYEDEPTLFEDILEYSIDNEMDHRRGSNFYREDIIELTAEHAEDFPEIKDFEKYIGLWKTNNFIWDSEYGGDDEVSELRRVEKRVKVVETIEWVEV